MLISNMKKIIYLLLFVFSNTAFGQDLMTYKDCLELAMKENLDLKTAVNSNQIARVKYQSSFGKLLPNIYGTGENKNSWGRDIDPNSNLFY